jgi:hypothetical protein
MAGAVSDVLLPERALTGRFCQWNCSQEALAAVLASRWGIDASEQDLLRFVALADIAGPLASGRDPGEYGGVPLAALAVRYSVRWRWTDPDREGLATSLSTFGPLLARVERGRLPGPWTSGSRTGPHVVLVVGVQGADVLWSDHEAVRQPARTRLEVFRQALLPATGDPASPPFLVAVGAAQPLPAGEPERTAARYGAWALDSLRRPEEAVSAALDAVLARLAGAQAADVVAYLNAARVSAERAVAVLPPGHGLEAGFLHRHRAELQRMLLLAQAFLASGGRIPLNRIAGAAASLLHGWAERPAGAAGSGTCCEPRYEPCGLPPDWPDRSGGAQVPHRRASGWRSIGPARPRTHPA